MFIITGILSDVKRNFIEYMSAWDPTKWLFLRKINCICESKSAGANSRVKEFLKVFSVSEGGNSLDVQYF